VTVTNHSVLEIPNGYLSKGASMNKNILIVAVMFVILLSGCGPSDSDIQAAIAQTEAARPTNTATPEPTNTPTPTPQPPTNTPEPSPTIEPSPTTEPSPTPVTLQETLNQTFSNVEIIYRDEFDFVKEGQVPEGWETTEKDSLKVTNDNELRIKSIEIPGMVFYYPKEVINTGEGVYFKFRYVGTEGAITLGFDNIRANGELVPNGEDGFRSVAMVMEGQNLYAHIVQNKFEGDGYFVGNITLQEDTWYHIALAYDEKGDYIIKIWDPDTTKSPLVYMRNWIDFPDAYYFISWISNLRALWMDDFAIFSFEDILQE